MHNTLALITIMVWPVIPLMWIPVHTATEFFRRLGRATYIFVLLSWTAAAYIIFLNRGLILALRIDFPLLLSLSGLVLLVAGSCLHIWTATLLTFPGITGAHEIVNTQDSKLINRGPFGVVRHPTYLAHTMMFLGIFLFTGVISVGILTVVDFVVANAVIIPLEEGELLQRFGPVYREYMRRVPRIIPRKRH